MKLSYFNIQKFCIHDGPGIRTTVFLKGCPLKCKWCHNPESQKIAPQLLFFRSKCTACGACVGLCEARTINSEGKLLYDRAKCTVCGKCAEKCIHFANAVKGQTAEVEDILREVEKDRTFYETSGGGMTVSGGEPSSQPEAVIELIEKATEKGISCAVETCGSGTEHFYRRLHELNALFLFDIKGIDPQKHLKNTGYDVGKIHRNLDLLISMGAKIILRLPLIPKENDTDADLRLLCAFLQERRTGIEYAEIMPYHSLGVEKSRALDMDTDDHTPDGRAYVDRWVSFLEPSGVPIKISGD